MKQMHDLLFSVKIVNIVLLLDTSARNINDTMGRPQTRFQSRFYHIWNRLDVPKYTLL